MSSTLFDHIRRVEPKFSAWLQRETPEVFSALKAQHVATGKGNPTSTASTAGDLINALELMKVSHPKQHERITQIFKEASPTK